ncbi:MAG: nucleotidyltransferase domain-containing protein [Candidatus Heimdallarchaeota archaeon]
MKAKLKKILKEIKNYTEKIYAEKLKQVILYGSQVRETATQESDIDILIIVDETLNPFEVRTQLNDLLWDLLINEGVFVSVVVLPENFYENYNSPFIRNVKEEGIIV